MEGNMNKGRGNEKMTRPPRVNNVPREDDEQLDLEIEVAAPGRNDAVPRDGLVGAPAQRSERLFSTPPVDEMDVEVIEEIEEPTGPGLEVEPTRRVVGRELPNPSSKKSI